MRDLYRFNAKGLDPTIWDPLMKSFSVKEVLAALKSSEGTAPGADGVTKSLLVLSLSSTSNLPTKFQQVFLRLLNA